MNKHGYPTPISKRALAMITHQYQFLGKDKPNTLPYEIIIPRSNQLIAIAGGWSQDSQGKL